MTLGATGYPQTRDWSLRDTFSKNTTWGGADTDVSDANGDFRHLFDVQSEAVILGGILIGGDVALDQVRPLTLDDFTLESHRTIFTAVLDLDGEIGIGLNSVTHRLDETGQLDRAGGISTLLDLDQRGIPGIGLTPYADKLRAKTLGREVARHVSKLSRLIETGSSIRGEDVRIEIDALLELGDREVGASRNQIDGLPGAADAEECVSYIIEPEVPDGCVIGLTGPSGEGKSTLATAWARSAIAQSRPVLILDRENPRNVIVDRVKRLGVRDGPLLRWWGGWCGSEAPDPGVTSVRDWVKSCVARGLRPLVIVDSLAAFNVGDENSAADMRRFMHKCRRLADLGAGIVVIHHAGKAESAKDFRGSSDFKASVDQAFHCSNLSSDARLDRLVLRCFKSRYGLGGSLIYRYADGRFIRDERPDAPARSVADQLTALLRQNPGIGARAFEEKAGKERIGRQRARDFLANGILVDVICREKAGRNGFKHHLRDDGRGGECNSLTLSARESGSARSRHAE